MDSLMCELTQEAFPQSINWFKSVPSTMLPICMKLMGFGNWDFFPLKLANIEKI